METVTPSPELQKLRSEYSRVVQVEKTGAQEIDSEAIRGRAKYLPDKALYPSKLPENLKDLPKQEKYKILAAWFGEISRSGYSPMKENIAEKKEQLLQQGEHEADLQQKQVLEQAVRSRLLEKCTELGNLLEGKYTFLSKAQKDSFTEKLHELSQRLTNEQLLPEEISEMSSKLLRMEHSLRDMETTHQFAEQLRQVKMLQEELEREKKKGLLQKISDKLANRSEKEKKLLETFFKHLEFFGSMGATALISVLIHLSPENALILSGIMLTFSGGVSTISFLDKNESIKRFLGKKGREIDRTRLGGELHRKLSEHPRFAQLLGGHILAGRILPMLQENTIKLLTRPGYMGIFMGLAGYGIFTGIYENFVPQHQGQQVLSQTHPLGEAHNPMSKISSVTPTSPVEVVPVSPSDVPLPEIPQSMISQLFPGSDLWNASLELGREWARTGIIPPNPEGHFIPVVNLLKNLAFGLEQTGDGKVNLLNSDLAQEVVRRFLALLNHQIPIQTNIDRLLIELGTGAPGSPVRHATPEDITAIVNAFAGRQ